MSEKRCPGWLPLGEEAEPECDLPAGHEGRHHFDSKGINFLPDFTVTWEPDK